MKHIKATFNPPSSAAKLTVFSAVIAAALLVLSACQSVGSCLEASCKGTVSLASVYKAAKWGRNVSVTFPDECTMTLTSNGLPNHAMPDTYLMPVNGKKVAKTKITSNDMALTDNPNEVVTTITTYNVCPLKAGKTTPTNMGTIGMMISGGALFNAVEGDGRTPALSDNSSYAYQDSNGKPQVAYFLDKCNAHFTPAHPKLYHYHAVSTCITEQVDKAGGPSHLIGVALDGFPIYGGRDMKGEVISLDKLDACNGITSATPEFPNGIYHYVLPENVITAQSSLRCYSGHVSQARMALAQASGVCTAPGAQPKASALVRTELDRQKVGQLS